MNRLPLVSFNAILSALVIITSLSLPAVGQSKSSKADKDQEQQREFDRPDEEEDLNQELWEFARQTPYADILTYVAAAQHASRAKQRSEVELPNGWRILPAGLQVEVGRLPYEAVVFFGRLVVLDTGYYSKEPQEVSIVDIESGQVVKTLRLNSLFPSAVIGLDGDLYISGGFDQKVFRLNRDFEVVREYTVAGFAGGLAAMDDHRIVVGYMAAKNAAGDYVNGKLAILNTETGNVEKEASVGYFPYAVRYLNHSLYVTLLGENKLLIYDKELKRIKSVSVGRTPQEMCTDGSKLYVTNTGSDSLSVIGIGTHRVISTISLADKDSRFGKTPSSCAIEGNRIYVTLAGVNAVAVLDKRKGKQIGLIPTAWYPTKVLTAKGRLIVANAKGIRARRPNPDGPQPVKNSRESSYVLTLLQGTVSIIPLKDVGANLPVWTRKVESASPIFSPRKGFKLPIHHIFYIIKENRTYDQVLGDLGRGNGDPKLTIFGETISPVHHQLAREFVTLDNFFVNGEISVLGHSFTTSGYASPFLEWLGNVSYSQRWKGYPFGAVPAVTSPTYLWDVLDEKHVDYRIYGENYFLFTRAYRILTETYGEDSDLAKKFYAKSVASAAAIDRGNQFYRLAKPYYGQASSVTAAMRLLEKHDFANVLSDFLTGDSSLALALQKDQTLRLKFAEYLFRFPFNYRSWDLKTSDLERVSAWKTDFESQLKSGRIAQFHYLWLPNDHTDGANDRILDPFQFVAQNDAALGKIIETISHSSIWRESLILVEEDDAQNGPDHVDATRTVALVAGPYVKRGALVNDRYDQLSMLRTIELLLGLNPMNLGDRLAVPMFGVFTDKPNYAPFVPHKISERLAEADRQRYQQFGKP